MVADFDWIPSSASRNKEERKTETQEKEEWKTKVKGKRMRDVLT